MIKGLSTVIVLVALCTVATAETVYLKNGDKLTGTIVEAREDSIILQVAHGTLEILKSDIERIDYTETATDTSAGTAEYKRNSAFIWRPLPTIVAAIDGYFDLVFEGQTAFTKEFALTSIAEFGSISGILLWSLQLGPQYRPGGDYLKGFLLGLYPGVGYLTDYLDWLWFFSITLETGYQWVYDSGFTFGLTTGGTYVGGNPYVNAFKFNLSAHLGYAYSNPRLRRK